MRKTKYLVKAIICIVGLIVGIMALGFAGNASSLATGVKSSFYSYGGDAYTGIQNAAANTSNNVKQLSTIISGCFAMFFVLVGFAIIVLSVYKFITNLFDFLDSRTFESENIFYTKSAKCIEVTEEGEYLCKNCWKKVDKYDEVCPHCGSDMGEKATHETPPQANYFCRNCFAELKSSDKHCPNCGKKI